MFYYFIWLHRYFQFFLFHIKVDISLFSQICVSSEGERSGFIRVASGKKRGYVPCDVLEVIWDDRSEKQREGRDDEPPGGQRRWKQNQKKWRRETRERLVVWTEKWCWFCQWGSTLLQVKVSLTSSPPVSTESDAKMTDWRQDISVSLHLI